MVNLAENYPLISEDKVIEFKNEYGEVINNKNDLVRLITVLEAEVDAIVTGDKQFVN